MAIRSTNRTIVVCAPAGSAAFTLGARVAGFQTFASVGDGQKVIYHAYEVDGSGNPNGDAEIGIGTYTSSGTSLSRDTIIWSIVAGVVGSSKVTFGGVFTLRIGIGPVGDSVPDIEGGCEIRYNNTSSVDVLAGSYRDFVYPIPITNSTKTNVSATKGSADCDAQTGAGTISSSTTAVTGVGTAFLTAFGVRALSNGTYTTVGTAVTFTPSGSALGIGADEVKLGDLLGDATKGYSRVTAVASNGLGATLVAALPNGDATASSGNVIENAFFTCINDAANNPSRVNKIASNTSLTLEVAPGVAAPALSSYRIGDVGLNSSSANIFCHLWIAKIPDGGGVVKISTQRTALLPGFSSSFPFSRRIGSIVLQSDGNILPFSQVVMGSVRKYVFEIPINTQGGLGVQNVAASTAWNRVVASNMLPPTATMIILNRTAVSSAASGFYVHTRKSGIGSATVSRGDYAVTAGLLGARMDSLKDQPIDGTGAFDWGCNTTNGNVYMECLGYYEDINDYRVGFPRI